MTEPIASREYTLTVAGHRTTISVKLGKPAPFPDPPNGDWYCPWSIEGADWIRQQYAGGVDALQALLLAVSGLRSDLQVLARKGELTWLDDERLGLDLIGA